METNGLHTLSICVRAPYTFQRRLIAQKRIESSDHRAVEVVSTVLRTDALLLVVHAETNPACKLAAKYHEIS